MEFDTAKAFFKSTFTFDRQSAMATTEIFINKNLWYADDGYSLVMYRDENVHLPVGFNMIQLQNDNLVMIELKDGYRNHGKMLTIEIYPYIEQQKIENEEN